MNLSKYLESPGAAIHIATQLEVSSVMVSQWKSGKKQVPAERCPSIERATGGAVTCEELRPDVDWAVLRQLGPGKTVKKAA